MKKAANFSILIILIVLALGCTKAPGEPTAEQEEFVDTGILAVESSPSGADVYVDSELKGQTPLALYNFPVGYYNVKVQKTGYFDFEKIAAVKVGLTEEIDAKLSPVQKEAPKQGAEQEKEAEEQKPAAETNKVNLSAFAMYHDFENKRFTELREGTSDVFSRKYDTYVDFVIMAPAKIEIVGKPFKEINKVDCINTDGGVANLKSGQTLCVITVEGNFYAVTGTWDTSPSELEFVKLD